MYDSTHGLAALETVLYSLRIVKRVGGLEDGAKVRRVARA
jgi:hypothetical protein